ncbi:hypothetical protein AB0C15_18625 [Micromonospora sp. NPDC048835]|uniref:hypothetical protein n=1 Tax=Micromonospora sp. NPDC048835 TaxID=3155147 RepID=UPI0033D97332
MPRTDSPPDDYQDQRVVYQDTNIVYSDQTAPSQYHQDDQTPYTVSTSQYYPDYRTQYAGSSSQAAQPGGTSGSASPETVYYSLSSASDGEDLAPTAREQERRWLADEKAKIDEMRAAIESTDGRSKRAAVKAYEKYKKSPEYRDFKDRRAAFNQSSPSRSAPASEIAPSDSRSSRSSPRPVGESQGYEWQPSAYQPTEIEVLRTKYGYPAPETDLQQSMQNLIMYTNEWAGKGLAYAMLSPERKDWLAENWAKIPKAAIDNISTALTTADAALSGSSSPTATAIRYMAHITQAYQSTAAIGNFMESAAQGRSRLDASKNIAQITGVGLDYGTMYSGQPILGAVSGAFKGFVQPGTEAVTQLAENLHETHLEQRNARREAVGGGPADQNRYATGSNLESQGRDRVRRGGNDTVEPQITRPRRAKVHAHGGS